MLECFVRIRWYTYVTDAVLYKLDTHVPYMYTGITACKPYVTLK
jgi:hypothetical protein